MIIYLVNLKENKIGGPIFSDFESYYEATLIKTVWYLWDGS